MSDSVRSVLASEIVLKCHKCDKLLAEDITPPFRIQCKCKAVSKVEADEPLRLTISTNPG